MTAFALLALAPWLLLVLGLPVLLLARGTRVSAFSAPASADAPLVSIIVPARNEALNISACVASLMNCVYPRKEIIVVDDGSEDGTADIVRILEEHANGTLRLVAGEPLPAGWLGKPWACWQGYRRARGDVLLFTDADTRHEDTLLGHAVGALLSRKVDLVSVMPRQLMVGFWERLVLPPIFAILLMRFHDLRRVNRTRNPRDVLANGQFILIRRDAYEAIGGHEALRAEVVEDQRIAQRVVASGRRLFLGWAEDLIETRMYRSLGGIVEGWSKNLAPGSRQASPEWIAPAVPWLIVAFVLGMWVVPPFLALSALFGRLLPAVALWALLATALGLLFWLIVYASQRVPPAYAFGFPIAALLVVALFVRSAAQGPQVQWKGRTYRLGSTGDGTPAGRQDAGTSDGPSERRS